MKKLFIASLLLIFFLSACGTNAAPTPTLIPTTVVPPTVAAPPTATTNPTNTTITPTESTTSVACSDAATFMYDVTIPDYTHMDPREFFNKAWRIKNTGTCTWSSSYLAVYLSGDHLGEKDSVPLSNTAPGATLDISLDMTAPPSDGTYKAFYQLEDPAGKAMAIDNGNTIWAIITVGKVYVYASPIPQASSSTPNSPSTSGGTGTTQCVTQLNAS